jgi:nucleoside-diphosphate-sugar epimerase
VGKVLMTGGSGFIGRNALVPPRDRDCEVHASGSREADLMAPGTAARLVEELRPTYLLHFAWDPRPGNWPSTESLQWVDRSLRLLRAFADGGCSRAVPAGICAEYERSDEVHCVEDATRLVSAALHGPAKHGLSAIAGRYVEQAGGSLAWGWGFFVCGPHEPPGRLASLVASEVQCAVNVASGAGEPRPIHDLAVAQAEAAGRPDLLRIGVRRSNPSEPASITAAVERLRDQAGWRGRRTLEQGAADTIASWRQAVPAP